MKLFICEICGDAYIGACGPCDCPFCGAKGNFIKLADEAKPIVNIKTEISEASKKNLMETLGLETKASAIYTCMAGKADDYKTTKMYKRLAKIELEHAIIVTKLMGITLPELPNQSCDEDDVKNFAETIALEDHAVELYKKFAGVASEDHVRKFFGALTQVEQGHIDLIKKLS